MVIEEIHGEKKGKKGGVWFLLYDSPPPRRVWGLQGKAPQSSFYVVGKERGLVVY